MDRLLEKLTRELRDRYGCHTVILYGSRAQGSHTAESDYDVMGVRKRGTKFRIARVQEGSYVDIFVFSEKDLKRVGEEHLYMGLGKVLYQKEKYGTRLLGRIEKVAKRPAPKTPSDEIKMLRVWPYKMLDRAKKGDVEGNYRRSWLQMSLLEDYFKLRGKRFNGSKSSFAWLEKKDPATYGLFVKALANPKDLKALRKLVDGVTRR